MKRLAIVADNLIGANDAGIQFRKFGHDVQVILNHLDVVSYCNMTDVIAINTDTRKVSADEAYDRVYQVCNKLQDLGFRKFYKKIDSTLRGCITSEVKAMMDALSLSLAIIVPSYPAHGRIVENGYLQIIQEWGDCCVPVPVCYIPSVIKLDPAEPVAVLNLAEVRQGRENLVRKITELHRAGVKLIVIDAVTDEDLRFIAIALSQLEIPHLTVGSAGLAGSLPIAWKPAELNPANLREGTMIISGTLNKVTAEQISDVLNYPGVELIAIQSKLIYEGRVEEEFERVTGQIGVSLQAKRIPVVVMDTLLENRNDVEALSLSQQVEKFGILVSSLLGRIAKVAAEQYKILNLVTSGGGTAKSICNTLEISVIELERELLPGIPLGKVVGQHCNGLHLVTKAGGFGKSNSLRKVLELLPNN